MKGIPTRETMVMVGRVAKLGEFLTNTQAEANAWKKRMLAAVLPVTFPDDWDQLSENEKQRRLDQVIALAIEQEQK
jgi:hypothetical protein